jgi:hypothetical protein
MTTYGSGFVVDGGMARLRAEISLMVRVPRGARSELCCWPVVAVVAVVLGVLVPEAVVLVAVLVLALVEVE